MKTVERHRLKDNEIAEGLHRAGEVWEQNSRTIVQALGVVALVAVLALGYWWWQHRRLEQASALLAEARSIGERAAEDAAAGGGARASRRRRSRRRCRTRSRPKRPGATPP